MEDTRRIRDYIHRAFRARLYFYSEGLKLFHFQTRNINTCSLRYS